MVEPITHIQFIEYAILFSFFLPVVKFSLNLSMRETY
jgi:hypothetical protein